MAQRKIAIVITLKGANKIVRDMSSVVTANKKMASAVKASNSAMRAQNAAHKRAMESTRKLTHLQQGLTASFLKGNLAARGISMGIMSVQRALLFGVKSAVDFQFSMAKIKAITGVTGAEFIRLEKKMRDIAAVSPKTATQVAEAGLAMGKLGLSSKELEQSLEGIIQTSVVLDEEVKAVGETVVQVKNAFELSANDIDSINEKLFAGIANSALTLEKFSTAFSFSGAAAHGAGVDIGELIAVMGVLLDSGVKASTVGTQLRQIFVKLSDSSFKASQGIGGMTVKSDGLSAIIKKLNKDSLGTVDIYDQYGLRAISVVEILQKMGGKFDDLTKKVNESTGALDEASKILSKTVTVSFAEASSAFSDLFVEIGKIVESPLATYFKGTAEQIRILTRALKFMSEVLGSTRGAVTGPEDAFDAPDIFGKKAKERREQARRDLADALVKQKQEEQSFIAKVNVDEFFAAADEINAENQKANETLVDQDKLLKNKLDRLKAITTELRLQQFGLGSGKTKKELLSEVQTIGSGLEGKDLVQAAEAERTIKNLIHKEDRQATVDSIADIQEKLKAKKLEQSAAEDLAKIKRKLHDEEKKQIEERISLEEQQMAIRQQLVLNTLSDLKTIASAWGENSKVFKAAAITEVIAQTAVAASAAFSSAMKSGIPYPGNVIAAGVSAAAAVAAGAVRVAQVQNAADGFDGQVNRETMFRVGEAGSEQVSVKPKADVVGGDKPMIQNVFNGNIYSMEDFDDRVNRAMDNIERSYV